MPRKNKGSKQRAKKRSSIASSLVESMKNGTLGNDDLLSAIQRKDQDSTSIINVSQSGPGTTVGGNNSGDFKRIINTPQAQEREVTPQDINAEEVDDSHQVSKKKSKLGLKIESDKEKKEIEINSNNNSNNNINNNTNNEYNINTTNDMLKTDTKDMDQKLLVQITEIDHIKNRIRQKLIQRSKLSDRDIGFKLHHNVGELLENYELISLEVQKHLQSENEQSLYSYCNHGLSDDWIRKYTQKQEEAQNEKERKKEEYSTQSKDNNNVFLFNSNKSIVAAMKSKNEKKEEITITSILNNKNKRSTYASRKKLNELELQVQMKKAAEKQVRKAQLARFLARRASKMNGNGGYF
jgi:hypothetical protein